MDIDCFFPILDQLEGAKRMAPEDCSKGLDMIAKNLEKALGITPVCPLFEQFNPRTMEAIGAKQTDLDIPKNVVCLVSQKGYLKDGKVIRFPKVIVSC